LLAELEDGAGEEGDMVIGGEQSDQGNHNAGEHLDPALEIETAAAARHGSSFRQVWRRFMRGLVSHQSPRTSRHPI
jgi:hypothetical protein